MWKILEVIQKNLILAIPIVMIAGILIGQLYDMKMLKIAIMPLTFLMVYPMMVNLQVDKLFSKEGVRCQIVTQIINFAVIPFIAYGLGRIFFADNPLTSLGLLLAALLPTSGMTISWTGFAKGNISAAIKMTVVGLILGSIATPFYAMYLMGTSVEIPLKSIFVQILLIVFIPMVLGYITQRLIIIKYGVNEYKNKIKKKFPMFSTIGVLGIVFVAMSLKSDNIISNPAGIAQMMIPLVILYGINYVISTLVGKYFFARDDAIALVYGTVMRNLSIALAISMSAFQEKGSDIAIIIAFAYIVQVQSAAWYVKFTDKIFGKSS